MAQPSVTRSFRRLIGRGRWGAAKRCDSISCAHHHQHHHQHHNNKKQALSQQELARTNAGVRQRSPLRNTRRTWHSDKPADDSSINTVRKKEQGHDKGCCFLPLHFLCQLPPATFIAALPTLATDRRRADEEKLQAGGVSTRGKRDEEGNRGWMRVVKENQFTR